MKRKTYLIVIMILVHIIIIIGAVKYYMNQESYTKSFSEEELFIQYPNGELMNGFYCQGDMGKDVLIQTPVLELPKGIYRVEIDYTSRGPARSYRNNVLETQSFYEGSGKLAYNIIVSSKDSVKIQNRLGYEALSDDYLLIHSISVTTSQTGILFGVFNILAVLFCVDFAVVGIIYRKKHSSIFKDKEQKQIFAMLVFLSVFLSLPMMTGYVNQHFDTLFHMMRIEGIKDGLLSGQFPVRIQPTWLNEHGYATSVFYGELFLYVPALLRMVGIPMADVYSIYVIWINIATILVAFYCFKKMSGNNYVALAITAFYSCNIYRLTALYVRNALGKSTALIFYPLVLYGLWNIYHNAKESNKKRVWLPLVIGYTGIIQSHAISTLFAVVVTFVICLIYVKKTFTKEVFWALFWAALISVLINAWFLIPFLDYMRYPWIGNTYDEAWPVRFSRRAVYFPQLFMTDYYTMGDGLGVDKGIKNEMPVSLGFSAILVLAANVFFRNTAKKKDKMQERVCWILFIFVVLISSTLMPWEKVCDLLPFINPLLRSVQYPWRFLSLALILLSWMLFLTTERIKNNSQSLKILLIAIVLVSFYQAIDFESKVLNEQNDLFISEMSEGYFYQIGGEYLPVGANVNDYQNQLTVKDDALNVSDWSREYIQIDLTVENRKEVPGYVEVPLLNYKGYKAIDIQNKQEILISSGASGRVLLEIPPSYNGEIMVEWHSPWYWRIGEIISILMCMVLILDGKKMSKLIRWEKL